MGRSVRNRFSYPRHADRSRSEKIASRQIHGRALRLFALFSLFLFDHLPMQAVAYPADLSTSASVISLGAGVHLRMTRAA
jgi:hypothetical protein